MEDSDPTLRGLNRIRTRRVTSEDHSSSGGDDSPAIPKGKSVDDQRGLHKGRKIARWFSSYLNPKDSYKAYDNIPSNAEVQRFNSKMLGKKDEKLKHSLGQKDLTGNQSLPDSSSSRKTSITQKSFSHELGPRGGIRAFNLRACSYSDLKELLGSLHSKFDAVKEAVNAELAGFAGDVRDALEKGSLSKTQDTAEGLLSLSQECIEMTSSHFRDNCESIVSNLAERRQQCQAGLVKQLLTRMLFILTRSTRLLQFQKDGGPINEDCLVSFKQCLESVPPVDTKLGHKIVKTDLSIDFTEDSLSKHPLEDTVFHSEDGIRKSKAHSFGPSGHDEGVLPSKDGDVILHCQEIESDVPKEAVSKSSSDSQFRHDEGVLPSKDGDVLHCQEIETKVPKVVVLSKSSSDSHHEHGESFDGTGSVLCRICEKNVPTSHLESHSYVCAYADKCDLEGLDVDGQLLSIAVVLEQIVESYIQSWHGPSSSPEMSRIQSAISVHGSEGHSPKLQEWHDKGMEGMFEDLHEMDTACIDDPPAAASNNLKNILAMKLGSDHPASSNGSMTPASSSTTPRSSHFDLFWLEHNSPSEPEDVDQMNELADIARRGACTDLSEKGASAYLGMCLNDLLEVLRLSQLEALVIDTFGSRIKDLLEEKYHLAEELMGKRSKTSVQLDGTTENVVIPSQSTTLAPTRLSHKEKTSIEDFEIIKPISRGAFGKVFLARKRTTGDLFAIKVLKKLDMIRKNDIERILAERNILITVRNPFVVRFFYSFTCRDNLYLVMEYLNGGDLYSLLGKVGCLEEGGARIYVAELVLALEYLHSLGITHRDLKPDNILIARDGHIKLTDFGLSKIGLIDSAIDLSGPGTACSSLFKSRNQHDVFPEHSQKRGKRSRISAVGTPDYLAPEILLGTAHGYAADWWSVGIILFELITGIPPFSARLPEMIFDNILNRKIPWPRVPNDMSYEAKDLIDRLLNQDQDLRLGANGAAEVKEHPFFKEIDWDNLALQKAVFIPHPDNVDDTSYFISRYSSVSSKAHDDKNSNVYVSDATKSSSNTGTEADMDEYSELKECDSPTSPDLFSINFSFKNLSQLATMNYDALLQSGRTSKCSSPSQGL